MALPQPSEPPAVTWTASTPCLLRAVCLAVLVGASGAPGVVGAAPSAVDLERAREIFENGQSLYREGRYEDALVAFEESYRLSEKPGLLYNMANCSERVGDYRAAIDQLNRYRVYAEPAERTVLERRIVNLELRLADAPAEAPAAAAAPPPEAPPRGFGPAGKGLLIAGSTTAVVAGGVQVYTYVRSVTWVAEGDRQTWETWQPVNLAAGSLAAVGGVMAVTGLILGANGIDSTGPGLRVQAGPRALVLTGRF